MRRLETYVTCDGRTILLDALDLEEQALLERLIKRSKEQPDWNNFTGFYLKVVPDFYGQRGHTHRQTVSTPIWKVAQDLNSRLGIAAGWVDPDDYRSDLGALIQERFKTRREFCRATGLSEDMISHVLSGRKHLAIDTLTKALGRIGYGLRIAPKVAEAEPKQKTPVKATRRARSA